MIFGGGGGGYKNFLIAKDLYENIDLPGIGYLPIETETNLDLVKVKVRTCLDKHIVDIEPTWEGDKSMKKEVAGSLVAALNTYVGRCEPPLEIDKVSLEKRQVCRSLWAKWFW